MRRLKNKLKQNTDDEIRLNAKGLKINSKKNTIKETIVSIYFSETGELWRVYLEDVLNGFNNVYTKRKTEKISSLIVTGKEVEAEAEIKQVPQIEIRGNNFSNDSGPYSGLVLLEILNLTMENSSEIIEKVESLPYTYCWFTHLYNFNTIKIIVKVDSTIDNYYNAYHQVVDFYQRQVGKDLDFGKGDSYFLLSYQPDLYLNPNCKKFRVN